MIKTKDIKMKFQDMDLDSKMDILLSRNAVDSLVIIDQSIGGVDLLNSRTIQFAMEHGFQFDQSGLSGDDADEHSAWIDDAAFEALSYLNSICQKVHFNFDDNSLFVHRS